jgi:hypothetical protein
MYRLQNISKITSPLSAAFTASQSVKARKGFRFWKHRPYCLKKGFGFQKGRKGLKVVRKGTIKEVQLFKRGLKRGYKVGKSD